MFEVIQEEETKVDESKKIKNKNSSKESVEMSCDEPTAPVKRKLDTKVKEY